MDLYAELKALLGELERLNVNYALCGGVALAIHGAPRATQDIDILLPPAELDRVREAARACGFTFDSGQLEFTNGLTIQRFTKLVGQQPLMLDVLFAVGPLETVWAGRQVAEFEGGSVRVVSRQGLIALKLLSARPQDIADIKRLEELSRG